MCLVFLPRQPKYILEILTPSEFVVHYTVPHRRWRLTFNFSYTYIQYTYLAFKVLAAPKKQIANIPLVLLY
jgi:hypothetical protein